MAMPPAAGGGWRAADMSREQVDWFLKKRRPKQQQELAAAIGPDTMRKLHPWVVGRILDEREEAKFASWTGAEIPAEEPAHDVMINMESGKVARAATSVSKADRSDAVSSRQVEADFALTGLRADLERQGIEIQQEFWLTHSALATLTTSEVTAVAARADVSTISSNKLQNVLGLDVSRGHIRANVVPPGLTGAGISVAVIDTGVDASHPALAGAVGAQQDMTGAAVMRDDHGHGTHVAGIVASRDPTYRGIAPGASIIDIRIMNAAPPFTKPSWCTNGLTAAVTSGADIANNSWWFPHKDGGWVCPNGTCVLCTAADQAVALGVVVVVIAGNAGDDICGTYDTFIGCPGNARNVITVGATDDVDFLATFSSNGPTPDGRLKPDVAAPGVGIASLQAKGTLLGTVVVPGIVSADGTSQSAPHVAGVAALMLSKNGSLTPASVKQIIDSFANTVPIQNVPLASFHRIDALAAVNATPSAP
ncbi:S8 family serine peptidase [Streptomyces sp. NPDC102259]|uniref:S8 family serine peptidase n=1 Tax=Streptomyces sp. NPDC102259 TaxID=3366148 RepID=UPI00381B1A2D